MSQTPSVGRIVHYQSRGSADGVFAPEPRAAIITHVVEIADDDRAELEDALPIVALCVLNPTGMFFHTHVAHSEEPLPGCWSWPPRV